jgi:DNA-directed RNA polymerase subunit beta'
LNCKLVDGLCQNCYGTDLSKPGKVVAIGSAVGIIAAQSLGEPGTQLTMNTFHSGGIAGDEDITQGLPKVKQIFDNVKPKKEEKSILAKVSGKVSKIDFEERKIVQISEENSEEIYYTIGNDKNIIVAEGDFVEKGKKMTSGKIDLEEYLEVAGREKTQDFIKEEIKKVYSYQGIDINDKHIDIFARQMLSKVEITNGGDSEYLTEDVEIYQAIQNENEKLRSENKKVISYKNIVSSLKDLASQPKSFLAGISFQNTLKSLVNYSLYQPVDHLKGSKESLVAGQLIPVGEGFEERKKFLLNIKKRKDKI